MVLWRRVFSSNDTEQEVDSFCFFEISIFSDSLITVIFLTVQQTCGLYIFPHYVFVVVVVLIVCLFLVLSDTFKSFWQLFPPLNFLSFTDFSLLWFRVCCFQAHYGHIFVFCFVFCFMASLCPNVFNSVVIIVQAL